MRSKDRAKGRVELMALADAQHGRAPVEFSSIDAAIGARR
jgi:hypothetical protein